MLFLVILFIIYLFILLYFCITNLRLKSNHIIENSNIGVSIIVAIRDGEQSLKELIHYLLLQNYKGPIEFILVDDQSTDNTKRNILNIINKDSRFRYFSSIDGNPKLKFKKKALDVGISNAKYNYLLFTDVDCYISEDWVSTMVYYFSNGFEYIVGYSLVKINKYSNLVSRFQKMDLLLLMIMCRGSSYFGPPWASTGQNQGFTKELYSRVGGFMRVTQFWGDDTPFLQLCNRNHAKISFVNSPLPQIRCRQEFQLFDFLFQRARWVFDANQIWRINITFYIILIITFLFYLTIPLLLFIMPFYQSIFLILSKIFLEISLFHIGSNKFSENFNYLDFLVWQIFHIPYIILVGMMSFFKSKMQWKGRNFII